MGKEKVYFSQQIRIIWRKFSTGTETESKKEQGLLGISHNLLSFLSYSTQDLRQ